MFYDRWLKLLSFQRTLTNHLNCRSSFMILLLSKHVVINALGLSRIDLTIWIS